MTAGFWLNYFLALVVIALMLAGLYAVVRGFARGRVLAMSDRRMVSVLESTVVSQHASLHVVKVGKRYLLIGGGNAQLATLAELPAEDIEAWVAAERAAIGQQRATFVEALKMFGKKS
jgi:flagellar biogenesis protein FliO